MQIDLRINAVGAATFVDVNDIDKGDDIEGRIFEELPSCDELLVLLTPWAVNRNWLWVEIGAARALGLRIVPVLYEVSFSSIENEKGGTTFLTSKNAVDINDLETYFSGLQARVQKVGP